MQIVRRGGAATQEVERELGVDGNETSKTLPPPVTRFADGSFLVVVQIVWRRGDAMQE
ncbi:hypothetical protein H8E77_40210 [bacterium]|nr:hypothetical protein [bacterium]